MFYVNILSDVTDGTEFPRGRSGIPFVHRDLPEGALASIIVGADGKLYPAEASEGTANVFIHGLSNEDMNEKYIGGLNSELSFKDVSDTPENPIVCVLCSEIGLYKNIPANIKFMNVADGVFLAALIYGACEFNGIALERCNNKSLDGKSVVKTINSKELASMASLEDRETGYCFNYDVVAQAQFLFKEDKKGFCNYSCQYIKRDVFWLSTTGLDLARKRKAEEDEKRRKAEEERKAKLKAEMEESQRRRAEKEKADALEAEEKAKEKERRRQERIMNGGSARKNQQTITKSVGAAAFLEAVKALQG